MREKQKNESAAFAVEVVGAWVVGSVVTVVVVTVVAFVVVGVVVVGTAVVLCVVDVVDMVVLVVLVVLTVLVDAAAGTALDVVSRMTDESEPRREFGAPAVPVEFRPILPVRPRITWQGNSDTTPCLMCFLGIWTRSSCFRKQTSVRPVTPRSFPHVQVPHFVSVVHLLRHVSSLVMLCS